LNIVKYLLPNNFMGDYNRTPEAQETFKKKGRPKGEIKFGFSLDEEQKETKRIILENTVVAIKGKAGTGKTAVAIQVGLDLLFKKEIERIIIARPFVTAGEDIGYLPGGVDDKMAYLTAPIYNIMHELIGKEKTEKLVSEGKVTISPFGFLRGNTFVNSFVLIDEAQNATMKQTELMLGRLGVNSKMVFCGDMSQCDLKTKKESGFDFFERLDINVKGVKVIKLNNSHRHEIVNEILGVYEQYKE
ncbi:MAG: PhoH family protein, partial [Romboutsia sp.]|nr:PhoH family protein [Romboutsia sp.]